MNHLITAFGKLVTLRRAEVPQAKIENNTTENTKVEKDGEDLRGEIGTFNRAVYDMFGTRRGQEGKSNRADVLKSGIAAESGKINQVPSSQFPIAPTIFGLYLNNILDPSAPLRVAEETPKPPATPQDATVTIEQTWLLEDAVRNGKLDKTTALGEEVVVPPIKSRVQLPSILRRKKPEAQTTDVKMEKELNGNLAITGTSNGKAMLEQFKMGKTELENRTVEKTGGILRDGIGTFNRAVYDMFGSRKGQQRRSNAADAKPVAVTIHDKPVTTDDPPKMAPTNAEVIKDLLDTHVDVFKKVKLPDIHRSAAKQEGKEGETVPEMSKDERRAKKKKEKRERIERERRERKEKKNEKKAKNGKAAKDSKKGKKEEKRDGEKSSSSAAAAGAPTEQDQKNGNSTKAKKSKVRNIFSSRLRAKTIEPEPATPQKAPENSKDDECPNVNVGAPGKTVEIECVNSERKISQSISIPAQGASQVVNHRKSTVLNMSSEAPTKGAMDIHKEILPLPPRKEKESGPKTIPAALLGNELRKDNKVDPSVALTSISSKYKTKESTPFGPKQTKDSLLGTKASLECGFKEKNPRGRTQPKQTKASLLGRDVSLERKVKEKKTTGQVDAKTENKIDLEYYKNKFTHLEPPILKKSLVTAPCLTVPLCVPVKGKNVSSLAVVHPIGKTSGAEAPACRSFYASLEKEDCAKVDKLFAVDSKEKERVKDLLKKIVEPDNIRPSHLPNKELPPVFNPKASNRPAPPKKTNKTKRKGKKAVASALKPCAPTCNDLPAPGTSGLGGTPFRMKSPPKILPAIKAETPEYVIPDFPLKVQADPLRYITSDEEDSEVEVREVMALGGTATSGARESVVATSPDGQRFEPFCPQPPSALPQHQHRSEMLRRRAKRLLQQTFRREVLENATPSPSFNQEHLHTDSLQESAYEPTKDQAGLKTWDLKIEDFESCSEDDLILQK